MKIRTSLKAGGSVISIARTNLMLIVSSSIGTIIAPAAPLAKNVGFYHWGGKYSSSMSQGVEQMAKLGTRVARVTLSPRYNTDYNAGSSCYPNFSLTAIAQDPDVKKALDNENIEVFMLTAYDGTTFGDCFHHLYLKPDFYTPSNVAAIVAEYSDFTLNLYEAYRSSHKRFIITSWESDHEVYW